MTYPNKQSGSQKKPVDSGQEGPSAADAAPDTQAKSAQPLYALDHEVPRLGAGLAQQQGSAADAGAGANAPAVESAEGGQPLEAGLRRPLERFLQRPLDRVRVFTGPESQEAAESHGAYALTHGQNIHLGARGQGLSGGAQRALLAHEATHTVQQGASAAPSVQLSSLTPDAEGSPQERQAEGLSRAFMAHERGDSAGLAVRDSIGLRPTSAGRLQLARVGTNYGEFEDFKFNDLTNAAGDKVGVQMYLKFHPGPSVDAKKIGLTQAAEGKESGARINQGMYGERQATSGAGVGYFIDRVEGKPSPLYGTTGAVTAGADATKLGSYAAPGIAPLTAQQKVGLPTGMDYGGGSVFGYLYKQNGADVGPVPAELHDAPALDPPTNSSEQMFETAALAFEGTMAGTYLGSVEWGWRRDAAGVFTSVPIALKSKGVPTANFLTAANIWKTTKENYGRVANTNPTSLLSYDPVSKTLKTGFDVVQGTGMRDTGVSGSNGVSTFLEVAVMDGTGRSGFVNSADTKMGTFGRDTVPLPVPEIYTVNVPGGAVLDGETKCSVSDPMLPQATRVQLLGPFGLPGYVRVQVADGPFTGRKGVMRQSQLTRETLGTH